MDAAWDSFLGAQEKTRQYILSQPQYQDNPQSAAEGYRSLLYNMAGAIELSLQDPNFLDFPVYQIWDLKAGWTTRIMNIKWR